MNVQSGTTNTTNSSTKPANNTQQRIKPASTSSQPPTTTKISEEGHIKGFRTSPKFQTFFEAVKPFFNDIQEMRHYNITQIKSDKS